MQLNKYFYLVLLIFVLVLGIRLYFSFSSDNFATDESYFSLRYIQNVFKGEFFSSYDSLSYGGRAIFYSPLFYILFAGLTFGQIFMIKIFNEIILASLVFIIYFICKDMTGSRWAGLFGTIVANFIPIFFVETTNTITPYTLSIPLIFFMLYCLTKLSDRRFLIMFIVLSFVLPFVHSAALLFVVALLFYFFLMGGGALQPTRLEKESIFLSLMAMILITLILYKKALFDYGLSVVWQNLPAYMMVDMYKGLDVNTLIFGIGIVPLLLGFVGLYFGFSREKNKNAYLYSAFMLSILALLAMRLVAISIGLVFLAISLGVMSSFTIKKLVEYSDKLHLSFFRSVFIILGAVLIPIILIGSSVLGMSSQQKVDDIVVNDMTKLRGSSISVVAGNLYEGNIITAISGKKNVVDTQFLMAPRPLDRIKNIDLLYRAGSSGQAEEIIKHYKIDAIYLSDASKKLYDADELTYAINNQCFEKDGNIYYYKCKK